LCVLKGVAIGSHWSVVRRVVTETADEVLGTLTAVGIAEFLPASHAMGGAPVPRLTVALESDSVDAPEIKWSDKFALSWQQNHDVWSTVLRRPFDLTEIELAEERRAGMGGPIQRRFESAARPFRY